MSLLRASTNLATRTTPSRAAAFAMSVRNYADGPSGGSAGATANAKGWKQKEQAHENQYFAQAEKEKLKKLQDSIKKQREHLNE
ncbi:hypothetical protein IE53DRAFT_301452, partial [Violaceomyces palustris]